MDILLRGTLKEEAVRFFICETTDTVDEMRKIHGSKYTATAAAGRVLTAVSLMSSMLKNDNDKLSIIVEGDGQIGRVIATTGVEPLVKIDIINPDVDLMINQVGKLDVAKAIGNGFLTVTYDKGDRIPYSGKIELVTSEIGEDLAYYFVMSEQVPSAVALGVLVDDEGKVLKAGGFIIQLMPGCEESFIKYLEDKITTLKPITMLLNEGLGCEEILKEIFGEYEFNIYSQKEVKYFCDCSKEKVEKTLITIGKNEIYSIFKEQNYIEVVCHFCNTKYQFSKEYMDKLSF